MENGENKLIVGQIGIGYWGPNLLRNLVSNSNIVVKKVVDLSEERRLFVKKSYPSIEVSEDIQSILQDNEIQAVIISTPVSTHYDFTMSCLDSGKHVLVEKPMATSEIEVDKIHHLSNKKKLVAMVGHTFIFNSAVRYIKKLIDENELGQIRYLYSQRLNLGKIRSDVDVLWNLAPHDISIFQYFLNDLEPLSIRRSGVSFIQPEIEDVSFLNINYPGEIMANLHVSWIDPQKVRKLTIVGSKKMVVYDDMASDKIMIYDKGIDPMASLEENMEFDKPVFNFSYRSGDILIPKIPWREPLEVEIEHFYDCIINGIRPLTDTLHAKQVIKILSSS